MKRFFAATAVVSVVMAFSAVGGATTMPSGQRMFGSTHFDAKSGTFVGGGGTIEPAYNGDNGQLVYLSTPNGAQAHPNDHNVAPLYLVVYPVGSGIDPASLNCAHVPADNCADHGPAVSQAAEQIENTVYGGGVIGHDHVVGIAHTGGDFNVLWEPVLVLFTNSDAATHHLTTTQAIADAFAAKNVTEIGLPALDFHCASVSGATYAHATPGPSI
jgi:hypothetical protein